MTSDIALAALPASAPIRSVAEAATLRKDKVEPASLPTSTPYVSLEHIEAGGTRALLGFGSAIDVRSTKSRFEKGDVLYGRLRPYLNKVWTADRAGICSTDVLVFVPADDVRQDYLALFLTQPSVAAYANAESSGDLPRVSFESLGKLDIPIPQREIQIAAVEVARLLTTRATSASTRIDHVEAKIALARSSALRDACSGAITASWRSAHPTSAVRERLAMHLSSHGEAKTRRGVPHDVPQSELVQQSQLPTTWAWFSVSDLLHAGALVDVKDGNHGANHPKAAEFSAAGLPFITAAQVRGGSVVTDSAPRVDGAVRDRLKVGFAVQDDVILTHKGTVGRVAIAAEPCVLSPQTTYYRCADWFLMPEYLAAFFQSPLYQAQLRSVMSQTTRDFVPIREQYRLFVAVPPIEEQRELLEQFKPTYAALARAEDRIGRVKSVGQAVAAAAASATFERLRA